MAAAEPLFDPLRRKNLKNLPEERVRQALVRWLVDQARVPARLIAVEYSLSALDPAARGRADVVAWMPGEGAAGGLQPWLIAECKAPEVELGEITADQARRYAALVRARFVLLTNGTSTRYFELIDGAYAPVAGLPPFPNSAP